MRSTLALLISSTLISGSVHAAENPFLPTGTNSPGWTFVRGPHFDGHSPEIHIADSWPDEGPPVLWTRELGQGYSAFVAQEGRVFTQAQNLGGQYVYCLDAETGKTIWEYRYDWPYEAVGVYPGPRATPTLAGDRVYFAAPSGLIGCLSAATGKKIWDVNVIEKYAGDGGVGFGYSCTPVVSDGLVIVPVGGKSASIVALDALTGKEVWSEGDDPGSYSPVYPIEYQDRKLVLGYLQNSLVLHDRLTGELLVRRELSNGYDEHSAWPIYVEPNLWLSGPFRSGSRLLSLPEQFGDNSDFGTIWTSRLLSNDVSSSVLVDGDLYGFDIFDVQSKTQRPSRGMFRCLDFHTGEEQWSQGSGVAQRRPGDNADELGQSAIIAVDGKLLLLNERGELILLGATPDECRILARTTVLGGELTWTPPALHRGRVYLRNQSRAVCVYVGEPDLLSTEREVLRVEDIPQSKYIDFAAAILRVEPEYMFDVPTEQWLWKWYLVCLAIIAGSEILAAVIAVPFSQQQRPALRRGAFRLLAFVSGALGTTLLSPLAEDFIFTWPVCLFVVFEPIVQASVATKATREARRKGWRARLILVPMLLVCFLYFWLCRRLSLVFEWTFLMGFLGAIPFYWVQARLPESRGKLALAGLLSLLAFTGYYACSIAPYWLWY